MIPTKKSGYWVVTGYMNQAKGKTKPKTKGQRNQGTKKNKKVETERWRPT